MEIAKDLSVNWPAAPALLGLWSLYRMLKLDKQKRGAKWILISYTSARELLARRPFR